MFHEATFISGFFAERDYLFLIYQQKTVNTHYAEKKYVSVVTHLKRSYLSFCFSINDIKNCKKNPMLQLKLIFSILGTFIPAVVFGFTLSVTPTTEACAGNATLTFAVANGANGGLIEYFIYKLPNTTVPYASTTSLSLGGLTAGDYRVVAIETVGGVSSSQQQDVTITNTIVPLEFTVQSINQACASVSNISVAVTSGNAVSYEIFEGPLTFPSQSSNVFNNLSVGVYKIRVFDACGIGVVSTFTVTLNTAGLTVSAPFYTSTLPPSCDFSNVYQVITPSAGTVIAYPITVQYTTQPPNGDAPLVINLVLTSGDTLSQQISATLPTYGNEDYTYDLIITDACNTITSNSFTHSQLITLIPNIFSLVCDQNYFELNATNFTPPFTLDFTAFPVGFDPDLMNPLYPGPFNTSNIQFGDENNTVPLGIYTVTITDACGKTKTVTFEILDIPPVPNAVATNNGCLTNSGKIVINIPNYRITSALITSAPAAYPEALPSDVSSFIDTTTGILTLPSVPLGDYVFQLTDFCNSNLQSVSVSIPAFVSQPLLSDVRPGCELLKSSLQVSSGNSAKLTTVTITEAPSGFPFALPYNGSPNITPTGAFFISNLPAGNYTISATDECGFTNTIMIAVAGYAITSSSYAVQPNCGTFDLDLNFTSNATAGENFWLQKMLIGSANAWGHPLTEVVYTESSIPDATNSFALSNNATNYNLAFNGTFRIVRSFFSYNNGRDFSTNTADKSCIEVLAPTFEFDESLEIVDAYRMPCSASGSLDVIIDVNGALPLHFTIIEKDGQPFAFDNFDSNVFVNLDSAVYTFQVEDNCGNIVTRIFDVGALGSLITIAKPDDLLNCVNAITTNETFDLSAQSATILGMQSTAEYTLQYYTSITDAQSGINSITNLAAFNPPNNPQTIYAAVRYNELPNCYEITSFDLYVGQTPQFDLNASYLGCGENPVTVDVSGTNLQTTTYVWSDGSTGASVTVTQPGITNLTVTATNTYGSNLTCSTAKDIEVIISKPPKIDRIETVDWTDNENSITIFSSNMEQFEYSLDGNSFQSESAFLNLSPGDYTVFIRDKLGCGVISQQVWLLNYPKFFTPNGDGYNDVWFIENSDNEPDFRVEIFDRYGKLLQTFTSRDSGWDGMYNGREIFSNDYWFVVHRQDGKIFKGHFTLKR